MAANSRFAVAVHALALLGSSAEEVLSSDYIASSVNTNPVVIRRILSSLREAGLVESQAGAQGGIRLARTPDKISLADIYAALELGGVMAVHSNAPNAKCIVSRNIKAVFTSVLDAAEKAVEEVLAHKTLADLIGQIRREDRK